jgi:hypothetical protein
MATGQQLTPGQGPAIAPLDQFLDRQSMASVLLKQAKGEFMRDLAQKAVENGTEGGVTPMIASILQLDRQ